MIKNLNQLDVLFVNPPSPDRDLVIRDLNRSGRKTRERMIWPQTNLAYLAAMLKDKWSVEIIDCIALEMDWREFEKYLLSKKPRYVVANIISATLTNDMYTMFLAKSLGAITIGLGPHLTELYKESLDRFPALDFVIRGEAEITIRELLEAVENKTPLHVVDGIVFRQDGKIIATKEREFIENLDTLPFPVHEMLPLKKYRLPFLGNYTFLITSRGCPYKCIFCRQIVMWKGKVRVRSADNVFQEMMLLKKLGVKNIMLHADTFTANKKFVLELCRKIIDSKIKLRWVCNTHIATIDEEMVRLMKNAGCWMIAPGIETGSQEILDTARKGITVEQIERVVRMIHKAGIEVWGYFIFGLPGETKETIRQTIKFALKLPLDMANFAVAAPYPGTEFYRIAKENNWLIADKWEDFDQNYSAIVDYGYLKPTDIVQAMKWANFRFFIRPWQMRKIVNELFCDLRSSGNLIKIIGGHIRWIVAKQGKRC